MKRLLLVSMLIALVSGLILAGCTAPAPATAPALTTTASPAPKPAPKSASSRFPAPPQGAKTIEISYAGNYPEEHFISKAQLFFKQLIEERSKGMIKVNLFLNATLYKDTDFANAIPTGAVDMAEVGAAFWVGKSPSMLGMTLPGVWDSADHNNRWFDIEAFPIFDADFQKVNTKMISYLTAEGIFGIVSKKPIRKMEDLNGMKIRTMSEMTDKFLEVMGARPTSMSSTEVAMGLSQGVIDGALSAAGSFLARKWYESAKNVVLSPGRGTILFGVFPVVMNMDKWKSLPDWAQKLITETSYECRDYSRAQGTVEDISNVKALRNFGVDVYVLPQDEWARWQTKGVSACKDILLQRTGDVGKKLLDAVEAAR